MPRIILIFYFFLFCFTHLLAQNETLSSQDTTVISFKAFGEKPTKTNYLLLEKLQNVDNFNEKALILIDLANFHIEKGNLDSIAYYGNKLFTESLAHKNDKYASIAANVIAIGKRKRGLYDEAIKWHIKGISFAKKSSDNELINLHTFGLGVAYTLRKEYTKALDTFDACLTQTKDEKLKHNIFKNKGDVYLVQNKFTEAENQYIKALTFFKQHNMLKQALEVSLKLGVLAEKQHDNTSAFKYYNTVKNKAEKNEFYDLYFQAQNRIGRVYFMTKEYQNAHKVLSTAYTNAITWDNLEYQKTILSNIKRVYLAQEDYKNAYNVMTQYNRISNTIQKNQNKKEINELEVKYNTLQKENQIHLLEKEQLEKQSEINRQKALKINLLIGFLVILIPVVALLYMYYQKLQTQSKLNRIQEEVNQQKVKNLLKDQELELIKAAIEGQHKERKRIAQELHDSIGGNLASIKLQLSSSAKNNENYQLIAKQIDDTYNQVRDLSHNLIPKKFNENVFTSLVSQYIKNIKKDNKTHITFSPHPEKEINALSEKLKVELYKIIQELLTNAFKHAKATHIDIHLNKLDNTLKLLYEDDGVGFSVPHSENGVGLNNIQHRLDALSGVIHIDSLPNRGTVIDIDIPIK